MHVNSLYHIYLICQLKYFIYLYSMFTKSIQIIALQFTLKLYCQDALCSRQAYEDYTEFQ